MPIDRMSASSPRYLPRRDKRPVDEEYGSETPPAALPAKALPLGTGTRVSLAGITARFVSIPKYKPNLRDCYAISGV